VKVLRKGICPEKHVSFIPKRSDFGGKAQNTVIEKIMLFKQKLSVSLVLLTLVSPIFMKPDSLCSWGPIHRRS